MCPRPNPQSLGVGPCLGKASREEVILADPCGPRIWPSRRQPPVSVTGRTSQAGGRGFREEKGSGGLMGPGPGRGGGSQEAGVLWASLGAGGVFSAWSQVGSRDKTQGHCESPTCPGHWEPTLQRLCQLPALSQDSPPASCGSGSQRRLPGLLCRAGLVPRAEAQAMGQSPFPGQLWPSSLCTLGLSRVSSQ